MTDHIFNRFIENTGIQVKARTKVKANFQPKVDNFGNTAQATKPINSGLKGLEQRKEKFGDFKTAMK